MSFPHFIAAAGRHYPRVDGWVRVDFMNLGKETGAELASAAGSNAAQLCDLFPLPYMPVLATSSLPTMLINWPGCQSKPFIYQKSHRLIKKKS